MNPVTPEASVDYPEAAAALARAGMTQSPAEAHGFGNGLVLARVRDPVQLWFSEWYQDLDPADVLAAEARAVLERILQSVLAAHAGEQMHLSLLLPENIAVDPARLAALRDWCQGFLFGFGLGGEAAAARLSAQGRELLRDLDEITRIDTDNAEDNTENQSALIEIEEYVREGVMLIREELHERGGEE
jgi:uncharacterized protein YgfB (UPF0149 family)